MFTVTIHDPDGPVVINQYETLAAAIQEMQEWWLEEPDSYSPYLITNQQGEFSAMLIRPRGGSAETCHVCYANGTMQVFRCHYHLDEAGEYVSTTVNLVGCA